MKWMMALLLSLTAVSGCISDFGSSETDGSSVDAPELVDALAARMAGEPFANLQQIGEYAEGNSAEIDIWENYMAIMRGGAVTLIDIADPTNPVEVAVSMAAPGVKDVKWSNDGNYIFVGNDDRAGGQMTADASAGGIYVLDASEKSQPRLVEFAPVGPQRGPHMVFHYETPAGDELVFGANGDVSIHRWDAEQQELTQLASYSPGPLAFNRDVDVVDAYYQMTAHDMFVMWDDVEQRSLMYVANWDAGLRIVDVTEPSNPVEIGGWNDYPEGHTGNLHTVSTEWIGERRITVGAVEVGFNVVGGKPYVLDEEPSVMYVWDTTDASNIQLLGTWTNPEGETTGLNNGFGASTHNLQLEEGRVTMAHYGLGVWLLDVSTPEAQMEPAILGYYDVDGMSTWDALPYDGVIWSSGAVGVQALVFAADTVGEGHRGRA